MYDRSTLSATRNMLLVLEFPGHLPKIRGAASVHQPNLCRRGLSSQRWRSSNCLELNTSWHISIFLNKRIMRLQFVFIILISVKTLFGFYDKNVMWSDKSIFDVNFSYCWINIPCSSFHSTDLCTFAYLIVLKLFSQPYCPALTKGSSLRCSR